MAITIKSLSNGLLNTGTLTPLYSPGSGKSAVVKSIRFVNTHTTTATTLTLNLLSGAEDKPILPAPVNVPAKGMFVVQQEITLATGEQIKGSRSGTVANLDYVISGIERDV